MNESAPFGTNGDQLAHRRERERKAWDEYINANEARMKRIDHRYTVAIWAAVIGALGAATAATLLRSNKLLCIVFLLIGGACLFWFGQVKWERDTHRKLWKKWNTKK